APLWQATQYCSTNGRTTVLNCESSETAGVLAGSAAGTVNSARTPVARPKATGMERRDMVLYASDYTGVTCQKQGSPVFTGTFFRAVVYSPRVQQIRSLEPVPWKTLCYQP